VLRRRHRVSEPLVDLTLGLFTQDGVALLDLADEGVLARGDGRGPLDDSGDRGVAKCHRS
jgi:hypothetical protein